MSCALGWANSGSPSLSAADANSSRPASKQVAADETDRSLGKSRGALGDDSDRSIQSGDIIIVDVFGEKDLSGEHRVQKGGTIKYPLLGSVDVAGKTPSQVADMLQHKLEADYLVAPQVNVMVKEYRSRTVSVIGKVNKEGAVDLPAEQRIDIVEGIARAGGFQPTANKNRIELSRNGKTTTYKFDELKKETNPDKKIWLEPGDVIFVRESFF
jgi:polysaccharide export outer membrane protein